MELAAGSVILDIAQLVAVTAVIVVAFSQTTAHPGRNPIHQAAIVGVAFGAIMALTTLNPIVVAPGVTVDGRATLLVLAGLFGGPVASIVAAVVGFDYRALFEGSISWGTPL